MYVWISCNNWIHLSIVNNLSHFAFVTGCQIVQTKWILKAKALRMLELTHMTRIHIRAHRHTHTDKHTQTDKHALTHTLVRTYARPHKTHAHTRARTRAWCQMRTCPQTTLNVDFLKMHLQQLYLPFRTSSTMLYEFWCLIVCEIGNNSNVNYDVYMGTHIFLHILVERVINADIWTHIFL